MMTLKRTPMIILVHSNHKIMKIIKHIINYYKMLSTDYVIIVLNESV